MVIMLVLLLLGAAGLALLPYAAARYLRHLPDAPLCPGCRALTRDSRKGALARLIPVLAMTVVRECARCGWHGRMRLRLAHQGAPRG